ncbi:vitamin K epoxide reductase family protein [Oculatella sp. LEGE 06141]|uniref:vitamin K epoxide reductase family protein n=1 Tax=Oculatella sp. LEGE 06141 TaxID=1828648 RepID=UPI00187F1500|nr:vitamin K epoxide reductase family protein [Oculatella sp. LEGE 06141]MBE9179651.1 vitamin K epoxide reductase family protein [Oculatella sp. LEGE 06141]
MSSRRRQTPWMHRWSRQIIGAIAILGAINTGYITLTKLFGGETACPAGGCEQVLSSPYAYVLGLPLALFGLLAYLGMAVFALAPLAVNPDNNKPLRTELENWTWLLLFIGSTAMMVFSGYLMYIMATQFVAVYGASGICYYCLASALFATALFVVTVLGRTWDDVGQLFFTGIIVSVVILVGTLGVYANVNSPNQPGSTSAGQVGPPITTTSGQAEVALAQHLRDIDAKMYGAFWCPHCHDQKQLFGQQAARLINYIECDPNGQNSQTSLCQANAENVTGYPTWEVNGQFYAGTQTLDQLADYSGYQGPRGFSNTL